jgi:predicted permease
MMRDRFAGVRRVLRIRDVEHDIDEELAFHRERTIEELVAGGMTRQEATGEAHRRFGNEHHYRRELARLDRRAESNRQLAGWWQDVRYAVRRIGRWPGLTAAIVLTFALGIGANATIFGIIDRLLLRPPEHIVKAEQVKRLVTEPDDAARRASGTERLVALPDAGRREIDPVVTYPDYLDFAEAPAFASVTAYTERLLFVGRGDDAHPLQAQLVTGSFFVTLGVRPTHGRFFGADEDRAGADGVAVISWRMWREQFGGDRSVLGRTLDFGYGPYTIVGVAPAGFTGAELGAVDLWLPLQTTMSQMMSAAGWERRTTSRNMYWLAVVGRLAPGVAPEAAESQATTLFRNARSDWPEDDRFRNARVVAAPLIAARGPLASDESAVATWLAGVSLLVLLIACANVANLLLARMIRQQREVGVRLALGISRGRLLAQTLTESVLLALLGAAAALLFTYWGSGLVRGVLLPEVDWGDAVFGTRVVVFVLVLTLLTGALAGLMPTLQAYRTGVLESLRGGGRGIASPAARARNALTVAQAALSVVLLVGAGLFVRSLQRVEALDLGVRMDNVLQVRPVFAQGSSDEQQAAFYREAQERLSRLPGVTHAAASVGVPFRTVITTNLRVPGLDSVPRIGGEEPLVYAVGPGYFGVLGLPVSRGRGLLGTDVEGVPRVAVVNETMAHTLWPGQDPLGRCMIVGAREGEPEPPCTEVAGVVPDTRRYDLIETPGMQYYVPLAQNIVRETPHALLVRVSGDAAVMAPVIQRELLAVGPATRFVRVDPYADVLDPRRRSWALGATMFTVFGLLALVVAAVGMYSTLAFAVAQRTQELGIRAALGATRERLLGMVVRQGVWLAAVGVAIGLGIALLAGSRIAPLLFETSPRDPLTFGAVTAVLLVVAAAAAVLPALRATRVDPSEALRSE